MLPDKGSILIHNQKLSHYTLRSKNVKHRADSFEILMQKATHKTHEYKKQQQQNMFFEKNCLVRKTWQQQTKIINEPGYKRNSLDTTLLSINCIQLNTKLSQFKNTEKLQMFWNCKHMYAFHKYQASQRQRWQLSG